MIVPLPKLLQGIIGTLEQEVAAAIGPGAARAQLYACLDLLNNLADKIDWKREFLEAEIRGIEEALGACVPLLGELGERGQLWHLRQALGEALTLSPPDDLFERRRKLNQLLEDLIAAVNDPAAGFPSSQERHLAQIRAHIHGHLRNQAIRDALYLKPMMLKKISQG